MNLLTGEYNNTLDDKGRVSFPAKLRTGSGSESLVVTKSVDHCLWLFTPEEWEKLKEKIMNSASIFNSKNRILLRQFIAPAQEIEFDKSGRLSIPQSLREYASLTKDVVILGVNKYVEIWDKDSYKAYLSESQDSLREASEELGSISLL